MSIATNGGFTLVISVRFRGPAGFWERIIDFGNGMNNDNIVFARYAGNNTFGLSYRNGGTASDTEVGTITGGWQTIGIRYISGEKALFTGTKSVVSNLTLTNKSLTTCYIGKSAWADAYANIDIRELLMYDKALTDTEIDSVRNYLNVKFT